MVDNCKMIHLVRIVLSVLVTVYCVEAQFEPPSATVEPLSPVGIRISVPHVEGMSLVAYHVKFNDEFYSLEAGTIAVDVIKRRNGRWVYQDKSTKLKKGDVVHYWVHVVYNKLGYNLLDQKHVVTDFYDYDGKKIEGQKDGDSKKGDTCKRSSTLMYDSNGNSWNPCIGDILLDENFRDWSLFNRSQWTVVEQFTDAPDYEFVVYRNSAKNVNMQNGLTITPVLLSEEYGEEFVNTGKMTLEKCTGSQGSYECQRTGRSWNILPAVTSGRLNSRKFLNFAYGRVQIKAKLPRGDWIYPLLMLQSARGNQQIRVASSSGNTELTHNDNDISNKILWGGRIDRGSSALESFNGRDRSVVYNAKLWSEDFHVYELTWSPGKIILSVDGEKYDEVTSSELNTNSPYYLTIGLAVGGVMEFPDSAKDTKKFWRNDQAKAAYNFYLNKHVWSKTWLNNAKSLKVDYVKIWAL